MQRYPPFYHSKLRDCFWDLILSTSNISLNKNWCRWNWFQKNNNSFQWGRLGDEAQPQTTSKWKAKLAILSVSKKKVNQTTLPSNYSRRYKKTRRSSNPPILSPSFPFHHSFSKQPIILSSVALQTTHFSLSFKQFQSFTQSIHQHLSREKNSCNMRTSNGWKSLLFFQSLKRRTRILAKAIFLQRKILQVQKMQSCDGMTDTIYYIK